jgi:hypothetical protein
MLDTIPAGERANAIRMIESTASELGVPNDRARRILYWHAHRTKQALTSLTLLTEWLSLMDELVRAYNQEITLQQLRRHGPAVTQPTEDQES